MHRHQYLRLKLSMVGVHLQGLPASSQHAQAAACVGGQAAGSAGCCQPMMMQGPDQDVMWVWVCNCATLPVLTTATGRRRALVMTFTKCALSAQQSGLLGRCSFHNLQPHSHLWQEERRNTTSDLPNEWRRGGRHRPLCAVYLAFKAHGQTLPHNRPPGVQTQPPTIRLVGAAAGGGRGNPPHLPLGALRRPLPPPRPTQDLSRPVLPAAQPGCRASRRCAKSCSRVAFARG